MKAAKRKKLEAAGWKVGSADEFLGLTPKEMENVMNGRQLRKRLRRLYIAATVVVVLYAAIAIWVEL